MKQRRRSSLLARAVVVVAVVVLVFSGVGVGVGVGVGAGVVAADAPVTDSGSALAASPPIPGGGGDGGGNETENESTGIAEPGSGSGSGSGDSNETISENESGNESGPAAGGGGGGGDDGGGMFSIPSPAEQITGMMDALRDSIDEGVERLTELFDEIIVGISTPGEEFTPAEWVRPDNGDWEGMHTFVLATLPISVMMVVFGGLYAFAVDSRQLQRAIFNQCGKSIAMMFVGFFLLGGYFWSLDITATAISPGGTSFFHSTEGRAQLALGSVWMLILAGVNGGLVAWTSLVLFAIHELPKFLYAFWCLSWGMQCLPSDKMKAAGDLVPTVTLMLAPFRLAAAGLLLVASLMVMSADSAVEVLTSQVKIIVILLIVGIGLPLTFYKSYGMMAGMLMSKSAVAKANKTLGETNTTLNQALAEKTGISRKRATRAASSARDSASTKVANAKKTAMSRAGGLVLDAKYGGFPRNPAARPKQTSSGKNESASSSQTKTARQKAKNRMRRDAAMRSSRIRENANRRNRNRNRSRGD